MIAESIGFFVVLLALFAIGIGPSVWLMPAGEKHLAHSAAIAPAVGYLVIGLLGFPLVRYVGPAVLWTWPVTGLLVLASLGASGLYWVRHRAPFQAFRLSWPKGAALGVTAAVLAALCGPLLLRGINAVIYRSNASDVFLQMSLAEQLRSTSWQTILGGTAITASNLAGLHALATASPTAIFSARSIALPIGLSKLVTLSWAAEIARVPLYRFYYVHYLLAYALAFWLTLAIGDLLKLPRSLVFLTAVVVALGFWARFVLETDAGYEINSIPLLLLAVYSWIRLEQSPPRVITGPRLLLAVCVATLISFYVPLVIILAAGFFIYYAIGLWQRTVPLLSVMLHGVTAALAIAALGVTGQLDYTFRNVVYLVVNSGGEAVYHSFVNQLILSDRAVGVIGLPLSTLISSVPHAGHFVIELIMQGWAVWLALILAWAGLQLLRKSAPLSTAQRVVLSAFGGGLLIGVLFLVGFRNTRAAGKAFTYVYPYLLLSLAIAPQLLSGRRLARLKPVATLSVGLWFVGQTVLGVGLPYTQVLQREFAEPRPVQDFDLSPVLSYLNNHPPQLLLVTIPRASAWTTAGPNVLYETEWAFAYYDMYAFSQYPAYFQSGLIVDNKLQAQNMWLQTMNRPPDYAVILKSVDYIGPQHLGIAVAETRDLTLYRLSVQDLAPYTAAEQQLFRQRESETVCLNNVCVPPGTFPK